jgi:hypothetical protein
MRHHIRTANVVPVSVVKDAIDKAFDRGATIAEGARTLADALRTWKESAMSDTPPHGWISCAERMPTEQDGSKRFLTVEWTDGTYRKFAKWDAKLNCGPDVDRDEEHVSFQPTHWRTLTPLPKATSLPRCKHNVAADFQCTECEKAEAIPQYKTPGEAAHAAAKATATNHLKPWDEQNRHAWEAAAEAARAWTPPPAKNPHPSEH